MTPRAARQRPAGIAEDSEEWFGEVITWKVLQTQAGGWPAFWSGTVPSGSANRSTGRCWPWGSAAIRLLQAFPGRRRRAYPRPHPAGAGPGGRRALRPGACPEALLDGDFLQPWVAYDACWMEAMAGCRVLTASGTTWAEHFVTEWAQVDALAGRQPGPWLDELVRVHVVLAGLVGPARPGGAAADARPGGHGAGRPGLGDVRRGLSTSSPPGWRRCWRPAPASGWRPPGAGSR